jgi:hypothetical protein
MAVSLLELNNLYHEALARELIEKTRSCGTTWSSLGGGQFKSTQTINTDIWDFYISKTQIGNLSYKYTLDVKKNLATYLTIADGPLPYTNRDSVVKDLYEVVEIVTLQLDAKLKETLDIVKGLNDCSS